MCCGKMGGRVFLFSDFSDSVEVALEHVESAFLGRKFQDIFEDVSFSKYVDSTLADWAFQVLKSLFPLGNQPPFPLHHRPSLLLTLS